MAMTGVSSAAPAIEPDQVPPVVSPAAGPRVVLPSIHDPRLHVAAVVITLQVLGQTVLGFELSVAQILVTVATCFVIEVSLTYWTRRVLAWPASALLTANGTAFILRVPGTVHGDWWSLQGWYVYATVGALGVLSKWVIRRRGAHVFNPSNLALVVAFLVLGPKLADPQDLWWGPMSAALAVTLLVILGGGLVIMRRLQMLELALAFWASFAVAIGALAASGHCMRSRWSLSPVCGRSFWWVVVLSPEILVFALFMITDPKTTPQGRRARVAYGTSVGLLAALLAAPQRTEFATKVAILSALVVVCLARPLLVRWFPAAPPSAGGGPRRPSMRSVGLGLIGGCVVLALVVVAGTPARTTAEPTTGPPGMARPVIPLRASAVPVVAIGSGVHRLVPSLDPPGAKQLGRDLAADLIIEARAFHDRSVDLASTAIAGDRLASFRAAVATPRVNTRGAAGGPLAFGSTPRLVGLTVVVVSSPTNFQAAPRLGLRAQITSDPGGPPRTITFVITEGPGPALVTDVLPGG